MLKDQLQKLKRISPEETAHALLWGIDHARNRGMTSGELQRWEPLLLSATFVFEKMGTVEQMLKRMIDIREGMTTFLFAVIRTAFARFMENVNTRLDLERKKGTPHPMPRSTSIGTVRARPRTGTSRKKADRQRERHR